MRGLNRGAASTLLALGVGGLLVLSSCKASDFARGFASDPGHREDEWQQPVASQVDVLFVIDTSCSMEDEQEALAASGPSFTDFFLDSGIPLHIGATSTNIFEDDTEGLDGALAGEPNFISEETPDLEQAFSELTNMGIDFNHRKEKGLHAAWVALEELGDTTNAGFLREEANLVVIIVSDEPDHSATDDETADDWINWEDFSDWLDEFKGPDTEHRTQLSAIVGISEDGIEDLENGCGQDEDGDGSQSDTQGAKRGDGYIEAAVATEGAYQSICTEDWGLVLSRMGLRAAGLMDTFVLSAIPIQESIEMTVSGQPENRWSLVIEQDESGPTSAALYFEDPEAIPPAGSQVSVQYRVFGSD
ncbi:MAG: hypothetical protein CL928_16975 [Deltaproteobacteria bacterium]|nr:hypothetical protein [Deltaproteobacteria bacterium]